jgi:hypothetical protein
MLGLTATLRERSCRPSTGPAAPGESMKTKYAKLVTKLKKQGADDPRALAAHIGRKKLGAEEFQRRAAAGRKAAR